MRRPRNSPWAATIGATVLLSVHAGLLAYSATRHSPTLNEPGHLVAGLMHWEFGQFEVYRVNPPLVHYVAAIPVMLAGYEAEFSGFHDSPGARLEFTMGEDFIAANGERSIWLFTVARWACIPISLAGGVFSFLWSRGLWNSNAAGLLSLTLWCFDPSILAHGELITSDCAAAAFGLGAGYCFWRWLRQSTWSHTVCAGLALGLALLSKTTWIILFGLWPMLWLFWLLRGRKQDRPDTSGVPGVGQSSTVGRHRSAFRGLGQLTAILLLGLYVLNAGYVFDGTLTRLKDYTFLSAALTGEKQTRTPGNRFIDTPLAGIPVSFPKQYVLGIDVQKCDFESYGQASYLRGEWQDRGWWYYYLYGLAVKTPHGTQFLFVLAVGLTIFRWWGKPAPPPGSSVSADASQPATWRDLVVLFTPALAVLVLVSSQLEFNHHVRYVLPVLGFAFVYTGSVAAGRSRILQDEV